MMTPPTAESQNTRNLLRRILPRARSLRILGLIVVAGAALAWAEMEASWIQSRVLSRLASGSTWEVREGPPSEESRLRAPDGPYDLRLGYAALPERRDRLLAAGFREESAAVPSEGMLRLVERGLFPIYREKSVAGLSVLGGRRELLFRARYPDNVYSSFTAIPPLVWDALLWIENRELLDASHPRSNPAVEWDRLARAAIAYTLPRPGREGSRAGGSTLATQIEKFRHSHRGITNGPREKLRQLAAASVRAYLDGPETMEARRRIVTDYLNSVPLAAIDGYGEVNGLGNGLWAWYGLDFDEVNVLLHRHGPSSEGEVLVREGAALRAVLSLLIAQRRPSYYLTRGEGRSALEELVDAHLRLLAAGGVIPGSLRDTALEARESSRLRARAPEPPPVSFLYRKAANAVRAELLQDLGLSRMYDLDRLDLTVESTFDVETQLAVAEQLDRLRDPAYVASIGLGESRLLQSGDPSAVVYSFMLVERTPGGNLVRVQTDNFPGPFDLNRAAKLELGSTAKLRTLVTYLETVEAVHRELSAVDEAARDSLVRVHDDPLTVWTSSYLRARPGAGVAEVLEAAQGRAYSASPEETFFTGGGVHTFSNFDATHDQSVLSVREGFRHSVNLVFIRMMRDIVRHHTVRAPSARVLRDTADPLRADYLSRFADREGQTFTGQFYRTYRDVPADSLLVHFFRGRSLAPQRLAWAYRAVAPDGTAEGLRALVQAAFPGTGITAAVVEDVFRRADASRHDLPDQGYLAGVHPLEIFVVRHLLANPGARLSDVVAAGAQARQEVYRWLFAPGRRSAQDQRIRVLLEAEAFVEIGATWRRLGYPFQNLVPSLATAIGSSGDRPEALAELIGILVGDGVRQPLVRVERLRLAEDTPYETVLARDSVPGERVMSQEVAAVATGALLDGVENGTARRAFRAIRGPDGEPVPIGGKTGTGDNRFTVFGAGGTVIGSRVVNRTAAFAFHIGDRFFGVMTAFVSGPEAGSYRFTSALPVQVFTRLAPTITPLVTEEPPDDGPLPDAPPR